RFTEHVLDDLAALDHLEVEITGTRHAYRELDGDPRVRITQQTSPGKNDWFDLGFEITIEGRQIPFPSLFVALAQGRSTLLMPDRTYFSLDHPAFDGLRELIREGEALAEWEPEQQQSSRFQVDMWDDLQEVADETVAARWRDRTAGSPPHRGLAARPGAGPASRTAPLPAGGAAALPARGLHLARLPVPPRPGRRARRRHGPGQDPPDPRPDRPRPRAGAPGPTVPGGRAR